MIKYSAEARLGGMMETVLQASVRIQSAAALWSSQICGDQSNRLKKELAYLSAHLP